MRVNANNKRQAYVTIDGIKCDVLLDGFISQNRALDGDTVVIELLKPQYWRPL